MSRVLNVRHLQNIRLKLTTDGHGYYSLRKAVIRVKRGAESSDRRELNTEKLKLRVINTEKHWKHWKVKNSSLLWSNWSFSGRKTRFGERLGEMELEIRIWKFIGFWDLIIGNFVPDKRLVITNLLILPKFLLSLWHFELLALKLLELGVPPRGWPPR